MNIFLYELKALRKSTIIWTISILALAALFFSIYPGIASDAADFKKVMSNYPPAVRSMLGITLDNITSVLGFYSFIFSFIMLCAAVQAMNYGVAILSKEVRERTADFLLTKPVKRQTIVSAKLLAVFAMLLATNVVYSSVTAILANAVKTSDYSGKQLFMINATLFFVQLIFMSIGVVISVIIPRIKSVLPISLGIVFGIFIIGTLIVTGNDDWTRYLTPFKYFDIPHIMKYTSYEASYLIAGALIIIAAISASYVIYMKKDIHSVS